MVFELASGPLIGYFLGTYLAQRYGGNDRAVAVCVAIGFFASFYAVIVTLLKMNEIDRKVSGS